jgi:predicted N-acetyltransferase YhbS
VELVKLGALSSEDWRQLEGDEADPWDARRMPFRLNWRPKDKHVVIRGDDGRLIAAAGVLIAEIEIEGGAHVEVVGLGSVIVAAAHRGEGVGARVIAEALRMAETLGPDITLLFCQPDRAGLYTRYGFFEVTDPVLVPSPDGGQVTMPIVTMWKPLREGAVLPRGQVTLVGDPF